MFIYIYVISLGELYCLAIVPSWGLPLDGPFVVTNAAFIETGSIPSAPRGTFCVPQSAKHNKPTQHIHRPTMANEKRSSVYSAHIHPNGGTTGNRQGNIITL